MSGDSKCLAILRYCYTIEAHLLILHYIVKIGELSLLRIDGRYGRMEGWKDAGTEGRRDGGTDGRMDGRTTRTLPLVMSIFPVRPSPAIRIANVHS